MASTGRWTRQGQEAFPVPFRSILFDWPVDAAGIGQREETTVLADLNLDQVLASMTAGRGEYNLKPLFCSPLRDPEIVYYRQEILRDLETKPVSAAVIEFARRMRSMRERLAQAAKLRYRYEKERWFLEAAGIYCGAVRALAGDLARLDVKSRGLLAFRGYLADYASSGSIISLAAETQQLIDDLAAVKYSIHIKGSRVRVSTYDGEADYSAAVSRTFAKFKQGAVKDHLVRFRDGPDLNHIEARILGLVAQLNPGVFGALDDYCTRHRAYLDPVIAGFDREVQFYLAYLEHIEPFRRAGLSFCYPRVSAQDKDVRVSEAVDLALAGPLVPAGSAVISNDFQLSGPERILVVTGPNQGGKTTFARMFGQLHYLASLGFPVPAKKARLYLADRIFTHFEKEESIETLSGKLADDLTRVHAVLHDATSQSIVIMNESFTATTLDDAVFLGREVMRQIMTLDLLCVYVTFVDELASLGEATVSMVSTVDPANPAVRTFKILRRAADGLAYAAAIAEKYGLTYETVRSRVAA